MDGSIEYWEKGEKIIMEKKAEIFSIFISAFSPYNSEYWDSAFYGRKRRKSGYFFHIHFRFFSISGNEYGENMENEYGEIMDLHKILHNILHKKVENEYGEIMDLHNILHKAYWEKYQPAKGLELDLNNPNNQAWNCEPHYVMVWRCTNKKYQNLNFNILYSKSYKME